MSISEPIKHLCGAVNQDKSQQPGFLIAQVLLWTGYEGSKIGVTKSDSRWVSEGLGFDLCVAPFPNVCVPNLTRGWKSEVVGVGWSWVRGVAQRADWRELSQRGSESEV